MFPALHTDSGLPRWSSRLTWRAVAPALFVWVLHTWGVTAAIDDLAYDFVLRVRPPQRHLDSRVLLVELPRDSTADADLAVLEAVRAARELGARRTVWFPSTDDGSRGTRRSGRTASEWLSVGGLAAGSGAIRSQKVGSAAEDAAKRSVVFGRSAASRPSRHRSRAIGRSLGRGPLFPGGGSRSREKIWLPSLQGPCGEPTASTSVGQPTACPVSVSRILYRGA